MSEPPIACRLSDPELVERRRQVLALLLSQVEELRTTSEGVDLRFDAAAGVVADLGSFIEAERECCRFLDFRLQVARDGGPIWLRLSGPPGTREFLQELFQKGG